MRRFGEIFDFEKKIYRKKNNRILEKHVREAKGKKNPPKKSNARHTGILPSNGPKTSKGNKKAERRQARLIRSCPPAVHVFQLSRNLNARCAVPDSCSLVPLIHTTPPANAYRRRRQIKTLARKNEEKECCEPLVIRDRQRPALVYCPPAQFRRDAL